jgi:hypothetical protein
MASLNHNFFYSERQIFLRWRLDTSGKTGGGFLRIARRAEKDTVRCTFVIPGARVARAMVRNCAPESITTAVRIAYCVYLLASRIDSTLYLGVTNNIMRRDHERFEFRASFSISLDGDKWPHPQPPESSPSIPIPQPWAAMGRQMGLDGCS